MNTSYERLRLKDFGIAPTDKILAEVLGKSFEAYKAFCNRLSGMDLEQKWQFYPCFACRAWMARGQYSWITPRGTKKEKNLYWLSVWDKSFKVSVWFKGPNRAELLKLDIDSKTKKTITDAKIFGQKMNTFPVEFEVTASEQLDDIFELIKCKKLLET